MRQVAWPGLQTTGEITEILLPIRVQPKTGSENEECSMGIEAKGGSDVLQHQYNCVSIPAKLPL